MFLPRLLPLLLIPVSLALSAQDLVQYRPKVAPEILTYKPAVAVTGELQIPITDALVDVGIELQRSFKAIHSGANLQFQPKTSNEAIQAFTEGNSNFIFTARELTPEEIRAFQAKKGYVPMRIPIAMDATIICVSKGNPATKISMEQLEAVYSAGRVGASKGTASVWGDVGLRGDWAKRSITPYARQEGAAIRNFFAKVALQGAAFKPTVQGVPDNAGLTEALITDPTGIMFTSISSWMASFKVIPVVPLQGTEAFPPTQEAIAQGKYPLVRMFYAYVNKAAGKPLPGLTDEALRFVLSRNGQDVFADNGLIPVPSDLTQMALRRLN